MYAVTAEMPWITKVIRMTMNQMYKALKKLRHEKLTTQEEVSETKYSRSSPCDHSRKRPALVTTTFAKPHLNCDLNFVMKSSRKRPRPLLGLPNWTFPLFLSSCKLPLGVLYALMKLHTALMVILI